MLSAEHYALEHRAVQALLDIRQREVSYMTERFNSIGTQSSLIGGFVVAQLTAIQPGSDPNTLEGIKQVFWGASAISLACSVHCILNSTFAAVWGPGLALRGPTGSVSRAYWSMVNERKHIMVAYVASLLFFVLQTIMGFYIMDEKVGFSTSSVFATVTMTLGSMYSLWTLFRMSRRFFFSDLGGSMGRELDGDTMVRDRYGTGGAEDPDQMAERILGTTNGRSDSIASEFAYLEMGNNELEESFLSGNRAGAGTDGGSDKKQARNGETKSTALIDSAGKTKNNNNKNNKNNKNNSHSNTTTNARPGNSGSASLVHYATQEPRNRQRFVHMGYLEKRGKLLGRWQKRYVRLQGTTLFFFDDEQDFTAFINTPKKNRKKPKNLSLRGFQILVKTTTSKKNEQQEWCFVLNAMDDGTSRRDRYFRCASDESLRGWVESLVAASLIAQ